VIDSGAMPNEEGAFAPKEARLRFIASYLLLVGLPASGVLLILARDFDGTGTTPIAKIAAVPVLAPVPGSLSFIVMVLATLAATRITGAVARRLGQPRVIGEMLAGILLGPSVLGWFAPGIEAALFPTGGLSHLNALGQFGLILFMFLVGLAVDLGELRHRGHAAVLISHVGIAVPVFLGVLLATKMYGRLSPPGVSFPVFALFLGAAMSITAFPVLAKILAERGMLRSPVGTPGNGMRGGG
jgi:predicted Kef-type K+ transport protein